MAELQQELTEQQNPTLETCAEEDISKDGGLLKKILKPGEGSDSPQEGDKVTVHYVGRLLDGTVFDSSRTRNEPFNFDLGKGSVIKGWDLGVAKMKKGELALLTIQPQYAYGERGSPPKIPPNATLQFEVELLRWTNELDVSPAHDETLFKKILRQGEGSGHPRTDDKTTISLLATFQDRQFDKRDNFRYIVDDEDEIPGLGAAVKSMKKGERSVFTIHPVHGYGSAGKKEKDIPPEATLRYEVELVEWEKEKESYEMNPREKIEGAEKRRAEGNEQFRANKFARAARRYESGAKLLSYLGQFSAEEKEEAEKLKGLCHLNGSLALLKAKDYKGALKEAEEGLKGDASNVKGLFRRGQALAGLDQWEEALSALNSALQAATDEATKKDISREISAVNGKVALYKKKESQLYKKMFSALS